MKSIISNTDYMDDNKTTWRDSIWPACLLIGTLAMFVCGIFCKGCREDFNHDTHPDDPLTSWSPGSHSTPGAALPEVLFATPQSCSNSLGYTPAFLLTSTDLRIFPLKPLGRLCVYLLPESLYQSSCYKSPSIWTLEFKVNN